MTQRSHSWAYIQTKLSLKKKQIPFLIHLRELVLPGASPPDKDTGEGRSRDDWGQQLVMGQKQLWKLELPSLILIPGSLQLTMKCHLP